MKARSLLSAIAAVAIWSQANAEGRPQDAQWKEVASIQLNATGEPAAEFNTIVAPGVTVIAPVAVGDPQPVVVTV